MTPAFKAAGTSRRPFTRKRLVLALVGAAALLVVLGAIYFVYDLAVLKSRGSKLAAPTVTAVSYDNKQYGFSLALPDSWQGYTALAQFWQGVSSRSGEATEQGPEIIFRDPLWTGTAPRQDLPVMIFTLSQWEALKSGKFGLGQGTGSLPSELGRNERYVFALPADYRSKDLPGADEVEAIVNDGPLKAF